MNWAVGCSYCNAAGITAWAACTLGGGTLGGGIGGGLVCRRGAWRIGGFICGTLDGEMVGGTFGLQFVAITVLSLLSSLVRM
jgi:hypothetical protein